MATMALEAAWLDTTGGFLFVAWEMTVGNWLGAPVQSGTVPTITVNGSAGPVLTNHGAAKRGTSQWIARYSLATPVAAGATVAFTALAGSVANGAITSTPSATGAAVTNNSTGAATPTVVYADLSGSVGGVGTEASPFCSLNEARVYIASGVTVYATGSNHEWDGDNGLTITGIDGWTIDAWPGQPRWYLYGACRILGFDGNTTAGYRVDGVDTKPELIGYGVDDMFVTIRLQIKDAAGVLQDYVHPKTGQFVDFDWPSYGMEEAAEASEALQIAAVQANTTGIGLWAYDSASDRVWIHSTQGDGDPTADTYGYFMLVRSNTAGNVSNGVSVVASDNWRVSGFRIDHWMEHTTAYAVFGQSAEGATISNGSASCAGRHALGFAATKCADNTMMDLVCDTSGADPDAHFIYYAGVAPNNVTNCRGIRLTGYSNTLLRWDSTPSVRNPWRIVSSGAYQTVGPCQVFAGHSVSSSTIIEVGGLLYIDCQAFAFTDFALTPNMCYQFTGNSPDVASADRATASAYPIQFYDPVFAGCVLGGQNDGANVAIVRPYINVDHLGTAGYSATECSSRCQNSQLYLESPVVGGWTKAGTVASAFFRSGNSGTYTETQITARGGTLYNLASDVAIFDVRKGTGTDNYGMLDVENTILHLADDGSSTSRLISGTTATGAGGLAARISFDRNLYSVNIPNNNFGFPDSAINTQAEWTSVVDPNGVYDVDLSAAFASNATLEPSRKSVIKTLVAPAQTYDGIDTANNERYGAWQQADGDGGRTSRTIGGRTGRSCR